MSAMQDLLSLIRSKIASKEVTITSLAAHAGTSRQAVYDVLNQVHDPSFSFIEKLANHAGIRIKIEPAKKDRKKRAV